MQFIALHRINCTEAIVAWLRQRFPVPEYSADYVPRLLADAIERGDHTGETTTSIAKDASEALDPDDTAFVPKDFAESIISLYQFETANDRLRALEVVNLSILRQSPADARIERLRETIVELWHTSSHEGQLHECLDMTFDEYATWVNPTAIKEQSK